MPIIGLEIDSLGVGGVLQIWTHSVISSTWWLCYLISVCLVSGDELVTRWDKSDEQELEQLSNLLTACSRWKGSFAYGTDWMNLQTFTSPNILLKQKRFSWQICDDNNGKTGFLNHQRIIRAWTRQGWTKRCSRQFTCLGGNSERGYSSYEKSLSSDFNCVKRLEIHDWKDENTRDNEIWDFTRNRGSRENE